MAKSRYEKKPLYRRINRRTHGVHSAGGGHYRWRRNTKAERSSDKMHAGMGGKLEKGLDYTPLYKFLLSKVGENWPEVHSEAVSRLPSDEPIYFMVAIRDSDKQDRFLAGENAYFSGLFVDEDNRLAVVNPDLTVEDIQPGCACCTHTFNGIVVTNRCEGARHNDLASGQQTT